MPVDRNEPAVPSAPADAESERPINWETIGQVVGVVAGLVAWIGAVGTAQTWARFEAADVPALPTLAAMDQRWLAIAGLQTLALPLLLGGVTALLVFYSLPRDGTEKRAGGVGLPAGPDYPGTPGGEPHHGTGEDPRRGSSWGRGPLAPVANASWRWERLAPVANARRLHRVQPGWTFLVVIALTVVVVLVSAVIADVRTSVLLLGVLVAGVFVLAGLVLQSLSGRERPVGGPLISWHSIGTLLLWLAPVAALVGLGLAFVLAVSWPSLVVMAVVTLVAIWLILGALDPGHRGRTALVLFVGVVGWSGALGFAQEWGDRTPDLSSATVYLKEAAPVEGFYLTRAVDAVLIALPEKESDTRSVVVLPTDDVERVVYGGPTEVFSGEETEDESWWSRLGSWFAGIFPLTVDTPITEPSSPPTEGDPGPATPTPTPDGTEETTDPPPSPSLTYDDVATVREATVGPATARLELHRIVRLSTDFVRFSATLTNTSPTDDLEMGPFFDPESGPDSSGIVLFDAGEKVAYWPAASGGACLCEPRGEVVLAPGETRRLAATFEATGTKGTDFDVLVPVFGWVGHGGSGG